MTSAEYKRRRSQLGHTQASLAKTLGLYRGTIARRESGSLPITQEAALAILAIPPIAQPSPSQDSEPQEVPSQDWE